MPRLCDPALLRIIICVAMVGQSATGAEAHVGEHGSFGNADALLHLISSADHILVLIGLGIVALSIKYFVPSRWRRG